MIKLDRPPLNKDELHALVKALWNVALPRKAVCRHHVSPFDAFAEAYFGNRDNWVLWYGSRGTGKSYMLAILALTKAASLDINVTLLGGSMAQSQNVHEHVESLLDSPNAPNWAIARAIATEVEFKAKNWIRPLPASQKTVRGPHPHMTLLDEIDEMEYAIYNAAMGQALAKPNARGFMVPEMTVASSTWQNPMGTFEKVMREAQRRGQPIRSWCWREVVKSPENPDGWMDAEFIERKRRSIPAEMFRVEYDLGEPAGTARAIDLAALERSLTDVKPVREHHKPNDDLLVFEEPLVHGTYSTGADWAKENDKTVIWVWRTDVYPHALVSLRAMSRRPWPEMIAAFNDTTNRYQGNSAHDATGIGNVVGDLIDERTVKMVMVGRDRTLMLTDYIAALENGMYSIPRAAAIAIDEHKGASVDDIYRPGTISSAHLPDHVAAAALGHRAVTRGGAIAAATGTKRTPGDDNMPKWMKPIDEIKPEERQLQEIGAVSRLAEADDIGVFWLDV